MKISGKTLELKEVDKTEFSNKVKFSRITNSDRLDFFTMKHYFVLDEDGQYLGYAVLAETYNKVSKLKNWILLNVEVVATSRGLGIGQFILKSIHSILNDLGVKSYIVTLNSFIMFKMIVRESLSGVVDFHCPINTQYPVHEMKEEEQHLGVIFQQNPNVHVDMIVSLEQAETERVKSLFFRAH